MRNQAGTLIERKPAYTQLIEFYEKIYTEQERSKKGLILPPFQLQQSGREKEFREGFPLLNRMAIPIDVSSSETLFRTLCEISKEVNEKLQKDITGIEQAIKKEAFDIGDLIRQNSDAVYIETLAIKHGLDQPVLMFLMHMSILPSLSVFVDQIRDSMDTKNWLRGYCPVCGSLPRISALRGKGQRFFLCTFCSFEWQSERLKCPFCENSDHQTLHYLYTDGDEICRVELCEKCKKYIKTIDTRKLSYEPDLHLEDIATIHLDILASEKGFSRPAFSPWGIK
ncbi:MAG: formate dehydrogenase accessory protein FdhE [Thermodesulfovibrionales bacterium]|nr:formate dehydrogenase accessory protein FdhE [Thermodesulfovibrionales bacterium]